MFGYFNKLRKKPKHVRDNIAFSVAGGFTLTLAIAWFLVGFNPSANQNVSSGEGSTPFSTLFSQIQEQIASVKDSVPENESVTSEEMPTNAGGEWSLSAQNASTSRQVIPEEVSIIVVPTATATATTSLSATSSVLY